MLVKEKIRKLKADDTLSLNEKKVKLKELQHELELLEAERNRLIIEKDRRETENAEPFWNILNSKLK